MFDFSLTELALCFVVALVVLGPQKLPAVARTLGRWAGQARVYMRRLSTELENETGGTALGKDLREARDLVRTEMESVKSAVTRKPDEAPRD